MDNNVPANLPEDGAQAVYRDALISCPAP